MAHGDNTHGPAERRKAVFLDAICRGVPKDEAMALAGWKKSTYNERRRRDREWAARCDMAFEDVARNQAATLASGPLSFAAWTSTYLNMRNLAHHLRIAQVLDETKPGETVMVNLWPGAGKSTTLLNWVTKALCEDPNHRIGIVSEASTLSRKFLGRVARRLEDAHSYGPMHERYGPFYESRQERSGKPWTQDQLRVAKCDHDEADYSLMAFAWNSRAYGSRIDTLIVDDVQSMATIGQTETLLDNLTTTWFSRDSYGNAMRVVVLGTRLGTDDIYARLLEEDYVDRSVIMPAVDHEGRPTVPEWWEMRASRTGRSLDEEVAVVRKRARHHWYAQYQQRPRADEVSSFAPFLDGCLDHERVIGRVA